MPLQKLVFKPGINRENTRYTTEGGWYECDKIRFRQGMPETIGGWIQYSTYSFIGVCRSLWNWVTISGSQNLIGLGTNQKFYINQGGYFYDVTPYRASQSLAANAFASSGASGGSTTITVTATAHGASTGDYVTFSYNNMPAPSTAPLVYFYNTNFQITSTTTNTFTIVVPQVISAGTYGDAYWVANFNILAGAPYAIPATGWGAGSWGTGTWGYGGASTTALRLWSQMNFGQDLVFGYRGSGIYYWTASNGLSYPGTAGPTVAGPNVGTLLNTLGGTVTFTVTSPTVATFSNVLTDGTAIQFGVSSSGTLPTGITAGATYYLVNTAGVTANLIDTSGNVVNVTSAGSGTFSVSLLVDVPIVQNLVFVSDTNRFIFAMGCNDYGSSVQDPMLIRWSDQNNQYVWTPDATNQAGSIRLSHGSNIVAALQTRQEIVVITDSSVYSLQYLGTPVVWGTQLLSDNITIASQNAATLASGVVYWMGVDKFYAYDGRVQTLNCDLRRYIFNDFNTAQISQVYAGTNEAFNEVWWLYCSSGQNYQNKYVIYNYLERTWYYGTIGRTAWFDSGLIPYPLATTYNQNTGTGYLIAHENGLNDNSTETPQPLNAYISSSEFDIQEGHKFGFVWRMLPDITFTNSTASPTGTAPQVTMTLYGLYNSGSGVIDTKNGTVLQTTSGVTGSSYVIPEGFTGQIYTRVRGRQMIFEISSNQLNTAWQLGAVRADIREDGRR
jgi:hypothetical protein